MKSRLIISHGCKWFCKQASHKGGHPGGRTGGLGALLMAQTVGWRSCSVWDIHNISKFDMDWDNWIMLNSVNKLNLHEIAFHSRIIQNVVLQFQQKTKLLLQVSIWCYIVQLTFIGSYLSVLHEHNIWLRGRAKCIPTL